MSERGPEIPKRPKRPFFLPEAPIDRYRAEWFEVNDSGARIVECVAVYYVNSKWAEVCPERADRNGADFVNQWQLFYDGHFQGRTGDGWSEPFDRAELGWGSCFATRREALVVAEHAQRARCLYLSDLIADAKKRANEYTAELATGVRAEKKESL